MTLKDDVHLRWVNFDTNISFILNELYRTKEYADVTLVSDDQKPFKAHKFVLSACSQLFKDLLLKNQHPHPILFLRGINQFELENILQFTYLGRDLQIKQLPQELTKAVSQNRLVINKVEENEKSKDLFKTSPEDTCDLKQEEKAKHKQTSIKKNQDGRFECSECDSTFSAFGSLERHQISKHEGIIYPCDQCNYKASYENNLKHHQDTIHKGVRFFCNMCDYKTTGKNHLRKHQKALHENVTYYCDQCPYKSGYKRNLTDHKNYVHEGIRYPCIDCQYQANSKGSLHRHKRSVHDRIRYPCGECLYQATSKKCLLTHKTSKHE